MLHICQDVSSMEHALMVYQDLVDEYPRVAAGTGMPWRYLPEIECVEANVPGLNRRDRLTKFLDRRCHITLRKARLDLGNTDEICAVIRYLENNAVRHPDPWPGDLQETCSYFSNVR